MKTNTAIKVLRGLHEAEVDTGNMKEARAIEEAIAIMEHKKANETTKVNMLKDRISLLERALKGLTECRVVSGLSAHISNVARQEGTPDPLANALILVKGCRKDCKHLHCDAVIRARFTSRKTTPQDDR